ncbi:GGDEF domain-containing protein [Caloramator sp. mosi_1]|uniref:GGDEF domain-containing protein n=1 Tax=Caloramator sp. mosi_1 TaxID=3023090 RepID=UPI00235EC46A|nr:GGDEF domain-containing protein [Caloramator sp. mosi_1]WDC85496.1 GGDEF domain-containing protein [Caloramator sp. mosi_1]
MDKYKELRKILDERDIRTFFQPIIDVKNAKIVGYEALSRGPIGSILERPDVLFETAKQCGLLWETEYLCRTLAIERAKRNKISQYLFLNVDPQIIKDSKFRDGFTTEFLKLYNLSPDNIIFEITEKTAVEDYKAFREVLEHYIKQGYKIAIDDTGAGYSGFRLITETKPQFIKLDMGLIRDIDKDSFKQALCKNLLSLSKITNMKLIAEGVETINELSFLIEIGVEFVQGYYLAKPSENISDLSQEIKDKLIFLQNEKSKKLTYNAKTCPIGKIVRFDTPIEETTKCKNVKEYFDKSSVQGVVIVKEDYPIGLVMKSELNFALSRPFGNEIYLNRPIQIIMNKSPLIVDYSLPISEVAELAMSRREEHLYDYVIVVKDNKYYGIVTVKKLLEYAMELELNYARHLNPLTGLPGNLIIEEKLNNIIENKIKCSLLYIDLDNFKPFNDLYGFENGDRVIKMLADILIEISKEYNSCFIGHIGGDDFVIIIDEGTMNTEGLCRQVIREFDRRIRSFYTIKDLTNGYVISVNREGKEVEFPLVSVSIACIDGDLKGYKSAKEIGEHLSYIKNNAKNQGELLYY